MNDRTETLFRTLTEMPAAPGFEKKMRQFVRKEMEKVTSEIIQDRLGSIFGVLRGDEAGPKIMVAGHMDEVGFLVTAITDNGMLKIKPLGGWWNQVILAQRMEVMTQNGEMLPGVVASTPPHLLSEAQRNQPVDIEHMFIDIGADSREHAESLGVRPGMPVVPVCPYTPLANPKKVMAKAWDNRYGVGLALELLWACKEQLPPNVLYSGATVQEEVGLRGAETAANLIRPDLFFALDASPANDASGDKHAFGQLGKGALLRIYDRTMITHQGMVEFILDTARTHDIPYQYFISNGGTDAGKVHLNGIGVPSAVIGVCARYIHTSASILHMDDYEAAKELLIHLVRAADRSTFEQIIQ